MRWVCAALFVCLLACTPAAPTELDEVVAAEATPQPPSLVDLTVYYRHGRGEAAYLSPVKREVPVTDDLPRTALQLLFEGPQEPADGLAGPLPKTTRINSFSVNGQTATVDLSREVVDDAGTVGVRPEHEYLALAAIANTLTEFPAISRVTLTVDGRGGGRFWGGWGVPEVLVRDDTVIDPMTPGPVVPDLDNFTKAAKNLGSRRTSTPVVESIRARPRVGYVRLVLHLTTVDGDPLVGPLPRTHARRAKGAVEFSTVATVEPGVLADVAAAFEDPIVDLVDIDGHTERGRLVLTVAPASAKGFYLHASTDPTQITLDIRR